MISIIVFSGTGIFYHYIFPDIPVEIEQNKNHANFPGSVKKKLENKRDINSIEKYSSIYKKNLFGTLESKNDNKLDIDIENLDKTRLKLKLIGTVVGFKSNYAVIQISRNQNLYREDDKIKDAVIKKILRQKVVLTRNGKDEILDLEMEKGQKDEYYKRVDSSIQKRNENNYQISRKFIDKSLNNINSLMRQARVKPHFRNGSPDGLTIDYIRPYSLFKKMGLQNGDILIGANGNKIKTVSDAIGLYHGLRNADSISIQIRRNGSEQTIEYNIGN